MALNTAVMQAVEKLGYRVTVGDVASKAGLEINLAEQGLLALASEAGGHLQVAESGEVAYLFPRNFRDILRNKYWRLRLQEWWQKVWDVLFYVIRVSFGILLILSIVLIFLSILVIYVALNSRSDGEGGGGGDRGYGGGRGGFYIPFYWFSYDWYWIFHPGYRRHRASVPQRNRGRSRGGSENQINFLEAIFSFLFGDGNPNADLEERRWQTIATVIRNNGGAVAAEQIAPYLDNVERDVQLDQEDYIIPVLSRFNGRPEVSPTGQIIYHFPELQVMAARHGSQPVSAYLRETPWKFSQASSGQIIGAIGLGGVNLIGALMLGNLLSNGAIAAELGGLVAFVAGIYWLLLGYGIGFLTLPLLRYFWVQWRNKAVEARNEKRQERAVALNQAGGEIQQKIAFAQQFVSQTVITEADLAYTTEQDLTEQEAQNVDKIDAEWRRRLEQSES
ncbi:MAG: hypothetical protein Kow00121_61160 [Elainellaceae cyanobacterium]